MRVMMQSIANRIIAECEKRDRYGLIQELANTIRKVRGPGDQPAMADDHEPPGGKERAEAADTILDLIDVDEFIQEHSVEEFCEAAESYFARITNWNEMLAKPFSSIQDSQHVLVEFSHLLYGLQLYPEMTVLDFGCGPGWASRILNQMGLEVISLDVSQTALKKAEELATLWPVIGKQPSHTFLHFDGRKINLPDESVDRIFCFDSFHHIPNQLEVLQEMSRVLKRGGIAGFSEPGPNQSKDPVSQMEMRKYKVLENDIIIEKIWELAKVAGFTDIKLALWNIPPTLLPMEDFLNFPQNQDLKQEYINHTFNRSRHFNIFFLQKGEAAPLNDSRNAEGLTCLLEPAAKKLELAFTEDSPIDIELSVENTSDKEWLPSGTGRGSVNIGASLISLGEAEKFIQDFRFQLSAQRTMPGESLVARIQLPPLARGEFKLEVDLVSEHVCWFQRPITFTLVVN